MLGSSLSFILQRKQFSLWICLILPLSIITLLFIFPRYLQSPIYFGNFGQQDKNSKTIQHSLLEHENSENNNYDCPYYGPEHGLFHPTVERPRFIITSGAGFIGSHFVKRLRQQN